MFIHKLLHTEDKSLKMSAPAETVLHGVAIRKLPIGKYIQVLRSMENIPSLLLGEAFPQCRTLPELLSVLSKVNPEQMIDTVTRLITVVPEQACQIISRLLDIPESRLLDPQSPDGLGLTELAEILEAFWKVNDLSDFFEIVRRLTNQPSAQFTGSSAG